MIREVGIVLALTALIRVAQAAPCVLNSDHLRVEIDPRTGAVSSILNKDASIKKSCRDLAFVIRTDRGVVRSDERRVKAGPHSTSSASFSFESDGLVVSLGYALPDTGRHFLIKTLSVKNSGKKPVLLDDLTLFHTAFDPAPVQTHFHTAGIISSSPWVSADVPINLFVRDPGGGMFLGIENPYFSYQRDGKAVCLQYKPRWLLKPGETFASDPGFIGVYKNEGIYCFKQTARPVGKPSPTGSQEILDWGEVWAMQDFMGHALSSDHPGKGFVAVYNACGGMESLLSARDKKDRSPEEQALVDRFAGKSAWTKEIVHGAFRKEWVEPFRILIDHLAEVGHFQILQPGTLWLGNGGFWDPGATYLNEIGLNDVIKPNPYWLQTLNYARGKGIDLYGFDCPAMGYFPKRADIKYVARDGKPTAWNCYACPAFANWHLNTLDRAITDYKIPWWQWDEGWSDIAGGECYATNHGHPPGSVSYQVYRNILHTTSELKRRHPGLWLVGVSVFQHQNPWILRSADESVIWCDPWYARNYLFIPPGKIYIGDWMPQSDDCEYQLLYRLSLADHLQVSYPIWRADPTKREALQSFWRKWLAWADDNVKYLRARRDLFGPPGASGLEGSAHIVDGRGFPFLFNPGTEDRTGSVPLDRRIGLDAAKGYEVRELYPGTRSYGVSAGGGELLVPVKPKAALVLEIVPSQAGTSHMAPPAAAATVQKAFLTLDDIIPRLREGDLWAVPTVPPETPR